MVVLPFDYDEAPERFRTNQRAAARYGVTQDVHGAVAERFAAAQPGRVLDVSCGKGRFVRPARRA